MTYSFTKINEYTLHVDNDNINIGNFNWYTYLLCILMPNQKITYTISDNTLIKDYICNKLINPSSVIVNIELYNNTTLIDTYNNFQDVITKLKTLLNDDNISVNINNNYIQFNNISLYASELEHFAVHKVSGTQWNLSIQNTTYNIKIYNDYGVNLLLKDNILMFTDDYCISVSNNADDYYLTFTNGVELIGTTHTYTNKYTYAIPFFIRIYGDNISVNNILTISTNITYSSKKYDVYLQDNIIIYDKSISTGNVNLPPYKNIITSLGNLQGFINSRNETQVNYNEHNIIPSNISLSLQNNIKIKNITLTGSNSYLKIFTFKNLINNIFTNDDSYMYFMSCYGTNGFSDINNSNIIDIFKNVIMEINNLSPEVKFKFTKINDFSCKYTFDRTSCYPKGNLKATPIHMIYNTDSNSWLFQASFTYFNDYIWSYTNNNNINNSNILTPQELAFDMRNTPDTQNVNILMSCDSIGTIYITFVENVENIIYEHTFTSTNDIDVNVDITNENNVGPIFIYKNGVTCDVEFTQIQEAN